MLDEAADQAAHQAAAMVIYKMREAVFSALKDFAKYETSQLITKLLGSHWKIGLVGLWGLLILLGYLAYILKSYF